LFFARKLLDFVSASSFLGLLLLWTLAAGALVSAVRNAEDGFEDDLGFHRELNPDGRATI
jgi:hypothetical protein